MCFALASLEVQVTQTRVTFTWFVL